MILFSYCKVLTLKKPLDEIETFNLVFNTEIILCSKLQTKIMKWLKIKNLFIYMLRKYHRKTQLVF